MHLAMLLVRGSLAGALLGLFFVLFERFTRRRVAPFRVVVLLALLVLAPMAIVHFIAIQEREPEAHLLLFEALLLVVGSAGGALLSIRTDA